MKIPQHDYWMCCFSTSVWLVQGFPDELRNLISLNIYNRCNGSLHKAKTGKSMVFYLTGRRGYPQFIPKGKNLYCLRKFQSVTMFELGWPLTFFDSMNFAGVLLLRTVDFLPIVHFEHPWWTINFDICFTINYSFLQHQYQFNIGISWAVVDYINGL